jgi:protein ImuA
VPLLHGSSELHADVWYAHTLATPVAQVVATGQAVLDAQLPGGGWPVGALTELIQSSGVHAEWQLLAPALARCGTAAVVLVGPPHMPFGPSLAARGVASQRLVWVQTTVAAQRLWATEQALRCAGVDAVLAWLPQARADQLRRLQMAAAEYNRLLFVMRPLGARQESSPAALRLWVESALAPAAGVTAWVDSLQVHLLKRRGPPLEQSLQVGACAPALARLLAAAAQGHAWRAAAQSAPEPGSAHVLDRAAA